MEPEEPSDSLSVIIKLYVAEQERGAELDPKTKDEFLACSIHLKEVIGDVPVKSIDYKKMYEYKQALMRLPANLKKSREYRGKTSRKF